MKTVVAKFSGGGVYTCKYRFVDRPAEWHEENVPGFGEILLTHTPDFSIKHFLNKLAAAHGQTVEITVEGESAFAIR